MSARKRDAELAGLDARIDQDLEQGRPWRARQRLGTWIHQFPERADHWRVRLGELHLAIHEDEEAGRLFCEARSFAPEHQAAITTYLERLPKSWPLHRALAKLLHGQDGEEQALPEGVTKVIEARGTTVEELAARSAKGWQKREDKRAPGALEALGRIGCFLAAAFALLALALGTGEIVQIIRAWLT